MLVFLKVFILVYFLNVWSDVNQKHVMFSLDLLKSPWKKNSEIICWNPPDSLSCEMTSCVEGKLCKSLPRFHSGTLSLNTLTIFARIYWQSGRPLSILLLWLCLKFSPLSIHCVLTDSQHCLNVQCKLQHRYIAQCITENGLQLMVRQNIHLQQN